MLLINDIDDVQRCMTCLEFQHPHSEGATAQTSHYLLCYRPRLSGRFTKILTFKEPLRRALGLPFDHTLAIQRLERVRGSLGEVGTHGFRKTSENRGLTIEVAVFFDCSFTFWLRILGQVCGFRQTHSSSAYPTFN